MSKKINLEKELQDRRDCLGWPYQSPGGTDKDCSQTGIDCSGMDVRAFKLQGNYSIHHGCNTEWRDGTFEAKGKLTSVSQLHPGYAVLLNRPWRDTDKSNKWYGDKDGNFTHIGHVLSVKPLEIIDASASAGKVRITTSLSKVGWTHWGRFKDIDYQTAKEPMKEVDLMTYIVKSSNNGGANVREKSSTTSKLLGNIPDGSPATVIGKLGEYWTKVSFAGQTGYVLSKLLTENAENKNDSGKSYTLEEKVNILWDAYVKGV